MQDCVFCKIIAGQIPSVKYWENEDFIAILDINPNIEGASLVISKNHHDSDFTKVDGVVLSSAVSAAQKVAEVLKTRLDVPKVGLVIEGVGVPHLHIKLYPFIGFTGNAGENHNRVRFNKYPGYLSTQLGPQADMEELTKLGKKLKSQ